MKTDCYNKINIFKCNSKFISSKSLSVLIKNKSKIHLNTSSNCDEYSYKCIFNNESDIKINCPYINQNNFELIKNCNESKFELNTIIIKNYNFDSNDNLFNGIFNINTKDICTELFLLPYTCKNSGININVCNNINSKVLIGVKNSEDNYGNICIISKNINNDLFLGNDCNDKVSDCGLIKINSCNIKNYHTIVNTNSYVKFIVNECVNINKFYINIVKGYFNMKNIECDYLVIYKLFNLKFISDIIKVNKKILIEGVNNNGNMDFIVNNILKMYCTENSLFNDNYALINFYVKFLESNEILNIGNSNKTSEIIIKSKSLEQFYNIVN